MKTKMKTHKVSGFRPWRLAVNACLFLGLAALPLQGQDNEDEWYDPSDWFDGNNVETADDNYDWWDNRGWYDNYDYDSTTTSVAPVPYHFYYWDPIVVGWTTSDQKNQNPSQASGQNKRTTTFDGKVDGFKKVNLKNRSGRNEDHSFVRIRLKNGENQVISLGSRVDMSDLDLNKGDDIRVSGRNARIDNRDVLVAHEIEVSGKTFNIRKQNRPDTGQQVAVQGTVKDYQRTSLGGDSREKNLIVRLEMKNGKNCVVDLGKGTTLQDLDLEEGSKIRLEGEKTKVDGKSLIVAHKIRVDGDKTQLRDPSSGRESAGQNRYHDSDSDYATSGDRYGGSDSNRTTSRGGSRDPNSDYTTNRGTDADESGYEPVTHE